MAEVFYAATATFYLARLSPEGSKKVEQALSLLADVATEGALNLEVRNIQPTAKLPAPKPPKLKPDPKPGARHELDPNRMSRQMARIHEYLATQSEPLTGAEIVRHFAREGIRIPPYSVVTVLRRMEIRGLVTATAQRPALWSARTAPVGLPAARLAVAVMAARGDPGAMARPTPADIDPGSSYARLKATCVSDGAEGDGTLP